MGLFGKKVPTQNELNTNLWLAVSRDSQDDLRRLLNEGADPTGYISGAAGPPLHLACQRNAKKNLPLLLAARQVTDEDKINALFHSCSNGALDAILILFESGVNVHHRKPDGSTLLHFAAISGHLDIVNMLLEKNVDVTVLDKKGNSAADDAQKKGHFGIAKILYDKMSPPVADPELGWNKPSDDEIVFVEEKPAIGYRLISIFNFSAATYTRLARNIASKAESQVFCSLDSMPDQSLLAQARDEFTKRGGTLAKPTNGKSLLLKAST